jgi:hypothetical protein
MGAVQLSLLHQGSLRSLVRRPTALWDHRQPDRRTLRPSASTAAPGPHATATTIRPQRREDATAARPQRPATGDTADPFPPGCLLQVGRIKTRGPRRLICLRHRPHAAARPSPHAAATFQHGHGDKRRSPTVQVKDALCYRKRPDRGGGSMRANAARYAGVRTARRSTHRPTGRTAGAAMRAGEPLCGWGGRLHDFSQPLWREPRRSWPQRRALAGRSTDCPTRRKLTGP